MFKSTKNMKSEMMDRLTEDVGGFNNAFTTGDNTVYFEVVPSNYLETLLWAEGDRMSGLNVDEANFKSERAVVEEEYRQSIATPPYGRFEYLLRQKSFQQHPYKRPTIGSLEDLEAASLADVQDFHRTYYRPDNATLIVVGDFDQKQIDSWIDKYLGSVPKPPTPLPRVAFKEAERKSETRFTEYGSNVPLPALGITYLTPSRTSSDAEPLLVAETILSTGESSRLSHQLVYEQQIAQSAISSANLAEDAGLFTITVIVAGGKKPEDVEKSVLAEIKKMQDAPVSNAELAKAINLTVTEQLREHETSSGRALALGNAASLGDPESCQHRHCPIPGRHCVRCAAGDEKVLNGTESCGALLPATAGQSREGRSQLFDSSRTVSARRSSEMSKLTRIVLFVCSVWCLAGTAVSGQTPQATPPPPSEPRSVQIPRPSEKTLANGLRVIVIERSRSPLVSAEVLIKNGAEVDPKTSTSITSRRTIGCLSSVTELPSKFSRMTRVILIAWRILKGRSPA